MKYIKNAKNLLILSLFVVIIFYLVRDCSSPDQGGGVTHEIDTVFKEVKVEVPKYVPKWRTRVETVEIPVQVGDGIPEPIDTAEVLKDYYAKYKIVDTLILNYPDSAKKTFGYGIVTDIVSKNAVIERSVVWNYKIPIVTHTITIHPKPRAQVYIGAMANVNSLQILSSVSGALLYKTKKDMIFMTNVGIADNGNGAQPFLGGGIFWKIQIKKPKVTDIIK
jgi:hypothetical protein